jgi:Rrf2 family protein
MRISKKAEYALRALVAICREPAKSWSITELARRERIPVKFLEQILLSLRHAGILASKRGVGGGYTLVRAADGISVGTVIGIFDGPLAPVPCAAEKPAEACSCPEPRTCPIRLMMIGIRREMTATFDGRTIEDMLRLAPGAGTLAFDI